MFFIGVVWVMVGIVVLLNESSVVVVRSVVCVSFVVVMIFFEMVCMLFCLGVFFGEGIGCMVGVFLDVCLVGC